MTTIAARLAEFADSVRAKGLPGSLREDSARRVLDVLGNSIAALPLPAAAAVAELAGQWGGTPSATAIGCAARLPEPSAALVNGTLAHALDFDDTHLPSVLHPSASVVPAALAAAEAHGASGAALLDAIGVGIEVTVRLGMAGYSAKLANSVFFDRGLHATAICGTVGAAVSAGMLAGLPRHALADVIGVAASMGSGLLEANRTGGTVKRVHCGWAAHAAVTAAGLVRTGITGPPTVLEGRFGFLHAFCGDAADPGAVTAGLGEHWELPGIFVKPYPCNHFTHAGIDAALRLRAAGVRAADITEIELGVPTAVLRTIGEPRAAKIRPTSGYHGAFSGPYTVAAALLGGGGLGVFHEDFTDQAVADPARLTLAATVRCVADPWCDGIFPHQLPAVLRVTTVDGSVRMERVAHNRGGPDNPLGADELTTKFRLNAEREFDPERVARIATAVTGLSEADSPAELAGLLH
jgi:2-methylcitrate dehydratase PrpD